MQTKKACCPQQVFYQQFALFSPTKKTSMATAQEEMKRTGRLRLTRMQMLMHFFWTPVLAFLCLPVFFLTLDDQRAGHPEVFRYTCLVLLVSAVLYFYRQQRSLAFREFRVRLSEDQFRRMFADISAELHWIQEYTEEGYIIATTEFRWGNWGTLVNLVRDGDRLLVNSICDLYKRPSTVSWGQNKRNVEAVQSYLAKHFPGSRTA
jgi:hypothetical protein